MGISRSTRTKFDDETDVLLTYFFGNRYSTHSKKVDVELLRYNAGK